MSETVILHCGLKYVEPEDQREKFRALPEAVQASWVPTTGRQDKVGDPTEYTLEVSPELAEELKRSASETPNVAYIVEAVDAYPHADVDQDVWPMEESAGPVSFPEPASLAYVGLTDVLNADAGKDVVFFHLDTGVADWQRAEYGERILGFRNWTNSGGGAQDASDRQGHGSMTLSLLMAARQARAIIYKVLGDDGRGGSPGIAAAIRAAGDYARANPGPKYILSGSLGGGFERFAPYIEACKYAESFGVLCRFSAGNDGQPRISAPANWHPNRSSIAFYRGTDKRADFSNHHEVAGLAADGQAVLMKDRFGNYVRGNGTSFSLPLWNMATAAVIGRTGKSVFEVDVVELANTRDTQEPAIEEGHGLLDSKAVLAKLSGAPLGPPRISVTKFYERTDLYYGKPARVVSKRGPEWDLLPVSGKVVR